MKPLFTSRTEFKSYAYAGEDEYVRDASGHLIGAALLGFFALVGPVGAVDAYWRSLPVLLVFASTLLVAVGASRALFRREWRSAARAYARESVV